MSVAAKICRRMSPKTFAYTAIGLTIILCIYYASYTTNSTDVGSSRGNNQDNIESKEQESLTANGDKNGQQSFFKQHGLELSNDGEKVHRKRSEMMCPKLTSAEADINTVEVFKEFDFQPSWMKSKEYWDKSFEDRFERQKMDPERPPLKVIIVPHSHNDPGWLKTFEHYFHYTSRQIMNHMVAKLQQYKNLTFIWSEVAFLNAWWEEAHPSKQRALRNLVNSGRLEITTGGWVMTDEANAHLYAMVDQLIEGHQWVYSNLGIKPKSGWSVDPFGHGSTQPYLMASSGIKGAVIQRIHYAWKQWLALKQYGDFRWIPNWSSNAADNAGTLLTHNQPFDIYSIKHSCGPHPYICLNFDFRKVSGEYTEYSIKAQAITDKNLKEKSELLLEQYSRTGSLLPHNVVLMPLGDDFRYNVIEEWDQQYVNYIKLIDYINANRQTYKAEIVFGTPAQYFEEIMKRYDQYPTLKGDFFVYSDIFSEGRPAYWSGYYTTRPFMKILDRELEHSLRGAEILYTIALNNARKQKLLPYLKILERDFEKLVRARRNLGLFQHHDAITGTSKSFVMRDYGLKLFEGIRDTVNIQQNSLQSLFFPKIPIKSDQNVLLSDLERDSYEKLAKKTPVQLTEGKTRKVILYNSLAQPQEQLIQIRTNTSAVKILDDEDKEVVFQVNPVWDTVEGNTKFWVAADEFEIVFIAKLKPLSVSVYTLAHVPEHENQPHSKMATIYCNKCQRKTVIDTTNINSNNINNDKELPTRQQKTQAQPELIQSKFRIKSIPNGDVQLENHRFKILFNGNSGFMKTVTRKHSPKVMQCSIQFAAYKSAQFHSGAYLFMPDPNERDIEKDVLQQYKDQTSIIITSGPVSSEITVIYGAFLVHSVAIYHAEDSALSEAIAIENTVDFENPPKNRETELFMRVISDVQNGEPPEFFTDANGFQMQKRVKIEKIGVEGNYFPITQQAYIQDEQIRLSLLTNHAQGAASWQPGFLELMLDRRTLYDDSRGMGEGLVDNRKTLSKHWLLIEDFAKTPQDGSGGGKSNNQPMKRFETPEDTNNVQQQQQPPFEKGEILRTFNMPTESPPPIGGAPGAGEFAQKTETFSTPSLFSNQMSNSLNYPASIFIIDSVYHEDLDRTSVKLLNKQFPCDHHLLNLRTQPDPVYSQFPSNSALLVVHRQGYHCAIKNLNKATECDVAAFDKDSRFELVDLKEMQLKSLTGIETLRDDLKGLSDVRMEPMTLKTFNMTFV